MSLHPAPTRLLLPFTLLTLLLLPTLCAPPPTDLRIATPDRHLRGRPTAPDPKSRPPRQLPPSLRNLLTPPRPKQPAPAPAPGGLKRRNSDPDSFPCTRRDIVAHFQCFCNLYMASDSISPLNLRRCRSNLITIPSEERSKDPCATFRRPKQPSLRTFKQRVNRLVVGCGGPSTPGMPYVARQRVPIDRLNSYIALLNALSDIVGNIFVPSNAPSRRRRVSGRNQVLAKAKTKTLRLMQYNDMQAP